MTGPTLTAGAVPVGPMLSMFDPIYVGIDEFGHSVYIKVIYKNLLAAGEPGGGKSGLLNNLAAHASLSRDSRNVLFDAKQVELGMWDDIADEFVGPDLAHALITLRRLQRVMDNRYAWLRAHRRREIRPGDGITVIVIVFDEIALYSTVLGTRPQQEEFIKPPRPSALSSGGRGSVRASSGCRLGRSPTAVGHSGDSPSQEDPFGPREGELISDRLRTTDHEDEENPAWLMRSPNE